jgi:hypothetical protein
VIESILSYGWGIWTLENKSKKKLFAEIYFLEKSYKALNASE